MQALINCRKQYFFIKIVKKHIKNTYRRYNKIQGFNETGYMVY